MKLFISPFVGRLDNINQDGMELVRQIKTIYGHYGYSTQIIVAAVRHPGHVLHKLLRSARTSVRCASTLAIDAGQVLQVKCCRRRNRRLWAEPPR